MGVGDLYGARRDPARDWVRRTTAAHRAAAWVIGSAALFACEIFYAVHQRIPLSTVAITIAAVTYVSFTVIAILAVACLISYWLTTRVLTLVYSVSKDDDALGGMWAVVATVFLFRDSYNQSLAAAVSRMAATLVSFVLCAVGLVAAWLGLRAIRPRIRPPESPLAKPLGEFAS